MHTSSSSGIFSVIKSKIMSKEMFSIVDNEVERTKTVQPGPLDAIWNTNRWANYEKTTALVHLIHSDVKVIVPFHWIIRMDLDNWWTSTKTYLCYYTDNADLKHQHPHYERVCRSRVLKKNYWRSYTAHVLELHCKSAKSLL